jgi:phage shock protein A
MHDKVCRDLDSLRSRRDMLKAKVKVAETQKKINNLTSNTSKAAGSIAKFDELEEKINKKLDAADAMAELNGSQKENSIEDLKEKYDDGAKSAAVDEELAALKASMGISQEGGAQ